MANSQPRVIVIPAKPELARQKAVQRQLRVAAYCRVSTDEEEQLTSYEAQKTIPNGPWRACLLTRASQARPQRSALSS